MFSLTLPGLSSKETLWLTATEIVEPTEATIRNGVAVTHRAAEKAPGQGVRPAAGTMVLATTDRVPVVDTATVTTDVPRVETAGMAVREANSAAATGDPTTVDPAETARAATVDPVVGTVVTAARRAVTTAAVIVGRAVTVVDRIAAVVARSVVAARVLSRRARVTAERSPSVERPVPTSPTCRKRFRPASSTRRFVATCSASTSRMRMRSRGTW